MASPNDNTNIVLPHLSLFANFCRPQTDTSHPSQILDGSPRDPCRDGNFNAISQAEFDALPTWSDIEDDPDFNHHRQRARDAPPQYSACVEPASCITPLLPRPRAVEIDDDDEDSQCGFWGEIVEYDSMLASFPAFRGRSAASYERKGKGMRRTWEPLWFILSLCVSMLVTIGVAFAMDLGASQYGYGTGIAQYMVQGMGEKSVSTETAGGREVQFCLSMPDRVAPGAQTWRFMSRFAPMECSSQVLTLHVGPEDAWKLHTSDELTIGDGHDTPMSRRDAEVGEKRDVTVADRIRALESGDDLAEDVMSMERI
ncbi:hypothetical protein NX059_005853 [Plenodomus lindquistii]|nr:hypothetical protein NX059_005853 [Plenodomus lindquistii]